MSILSLATLLYRKVRSANPPTKARIESFIEDIKAKGVIPLGLGKDASGRDAYWWAVYDRTKFASDDALMDYLESRSPPGFTMGVLFI
jgi:hypothetical protein